MCEICEKVKTVEICPTQNIGEFIDYMDELCITIKGFTWWCHVHDNHQPCGLGGPRNQ